MTAQIDTHKLFVTDGDRLLRVERTGDMAPAMRDVELVELGRHAEYVVLALGVDGEEIDEVWLGNQPDPIKTLTAAVDALQGALDALARLEGVNRTRPQR